MMRIDLRESPLYQEAAGLWQAIRQPGTGQISDAVEVSSSPDGRHVVFAGTIVEDVEGTPPTRICTTNLGTGDTRVLTFGPNVDRLPKFSRDGQLVAFLSDRHKRGDVQLYLLDPVSGAAQPAATVDGWVEYLHWSPDGTQILLGVAGHGADISGGQGAVTSKQNLAADLPSWMPKVETGDEAYHWRRAWVYELSTGRARQVSPANTNIWEAAWCGNDHIAAVVSPGPGEGLWYSARLCILPLNIGKSREVFIPRDQLGWPAACHSGRHLAIVEAVCSDRWLVAGDLRLIDTVTGSVQHVDTRGVDVSYTEWRSDRLMLLAGHREFATVVGVYDLLSHQFSEIWASEEVTTGGRYITVAGLDEPGDCVLVGEGYRRAPEIAVIAQGKYTVVKSFDVGYADASKVIAIPQAMRWTASDALEIHGWLLRPDTQGPHPLVMIVHGGPVWHWRPMWLGRGLVSLLLLKRGYAIFFPNPRGSAGRGQDFARRVVGDMGGADAGDCMAGLQALIDQGVVDPGRLGVTGASYGGFMTSWLITQDKRFAAAVPVAPVTNHVTEHLISNIPHFVSMFLADTYTNPGGKYFQRSPIMHASNVQTPTLAICGARDRCTPPEEAVQFHNALLQNGVNSVLVTYPEEGHGIRALPTLIDYSVRVVAWFDEHLRAGQETEKTRA